MPITDQSYPFFVDALVTLTEGQTKQPDTGRLIAQFTGDSYINEIRFAVYNSTVTVLNMGGSIRVKLQFRGHDMTNGFIPIWLFGVPSQIILDGVPSAGSVNEYGISHYRMRLPKPLRVPKGATIVPTFFRTSDGLGGTATVRIGYAGTAIIGGGVSVPQSDFVSYITAFLPVTTATNLNPISNEYDLGNPFNSDLYITQMIGRLQKSAASVLSDYPINTAVTLSMHGPNGVTVIKELTPFQAAFNTRRSWLFNKKLKTGEGYYAQVRGLVSTETPMISMIGYRQETI